MEKEKKKKLWIAYVRHVTSDIRLYRFFACNVEKAGWLCEVIYTYILSWYFAALLDSNEEQYCLAGKSAIEFVSSYTYLDPSCNKYCDLIGHKQVSTMYLPYKLVNLHIYL